MLKIPHNILLRKKGVRVNKEREIERDRRSRVKDRKGNKEGE